MGILLEVEQDYLWERLYSLHVYDPVSFFLLFSFLINLLLFTKFLTDSFCISPEFNIILLSFLEGY